MFEFLLTKVSHSGLNKIVLEASIKTSLAATGDGIYQLNCQKLKRSCLPGIDLQEYFYNSFTLLITQNMESRSLWTDLSEQIQSLVITKLMRNIKKIFE